MSGQPTLPASAPAEAEMEETVQEEALIFAGIQKAHVHALQATLKSVQPRAFSKDVRPVDSLVEADAAELAAKVGHRAAKKLEEGFRLLCNRMRVNEHLLAMEKARAEQEAEEDFRDMEISPLPGGKQPAEFLQERIVRLKLAEREKLSRLAAEAEARADEATSRATAMEELLEIRLQEVTATQQTLTEAAKSLP